MQRVTVLAILFIVVISLTRAENEIARGKPAIQSSTGWGGLAKNGNDGDTRQSHRDKYCTHTNTEKGAWWQVDLQGQYDIKKIIIYNRDRNGQRLNNFVVKVGSSELNMKQCAHYPGVAKNSEITKLSCVATGRYLKIELLGTNILTLCEVQVYGEKSTDQKIKPTENVALNKAAYSSSVSWSGVASRAVDGNKNGVYNNGHCSHTNNGGLHWLVIDLGQPHDVESVALWARTDHWSYGVVKNMTVKIGDKFMPCRMDYLDDYSVCGSFQEKKSRTTNMPCKKRGQFVAILKGGPGNTDPMILCEVEVFGTPVAGAKSFKKPDLSRNTGVRISSAGIGARNTILQGAPSTVTARGDISRIFVLEKNAEAVFWMPKTKDVYVAAAKVGKGRVIVVASNNVLSDWLKDQNSVVVKNIKKWLSGNSNAKLKDYWVARNLNKETKDTVLYTRYWATESPRRYDQLLEAIKEGKISAIFSNVGHKNAFLDKVMRAAGMYIPNNRQYSIYGDHTVNIKEMQANPVYPAADIIPHLRSIEVLQNYGVVVSRALKDTPKEFLSNLNIGQTFVRDILNNIAEQMEWKAPCLAKEVTDDSDKSLITAHNYFLLLSNHLIGSGIKAPAVMTYPGDFKTLPPLKSAEIEIFAEAEYEIHPTGFYLPPGQTMEVTIVSPADEASKWTVEIGCWRDDITKRPGWHRYPVIHNEHPLVNGKIHSSFGGNLVIWNKNTKGSVKIRVKGVVEAPYFNLRDPNSFNQWNDRRNAPGPWAEMAGDGMTLCFESKYIRHQTAQQVKELSEFWDLMIKLDHNLLGTDWRQKRRERVVMDLQISAGSGHSGYPIMAMLDWQLTSFNMAKIRKDGMWGMCHEAGHNQQHYGFTWSKTGEVTNNVFCIFNYEKMLNFPIFGKGKFDQNRMNSFKSYLNGKVSYEGWGSDAFLSLGIYAELAEVFGWGLFKEALRQYTKPKPDYVPKSDQEKIDTWAKRVSDAAKQNLLPIFDFWGLPISDTIRQELKKYPCVLPVDTITKLSPSRVNVILKQYNNKCTRQANRVADRYPNPDVTPIRANDVMVRKL